MKVRDQQFNIAVYGGTFDPPHEGHLQAAQAVLEYCGVDLLLFVVAGDPCQKTASGKQVTPAEDRLAMVEAMVDASMESRFEVSDLEVKRRGPSYMADTLDELIGLYPDGRLHLVIASGLLPEMGTWHNHQHVRDMADLIVVERPGDGAPPIPKGWEGVYLTSELPSIRQLPDLSSTQIRQQLQNPDADLTGLPVPEAVARFIDERGLYIR